MGNELRADVIKTLQQRFSQLLRPLFPSAPLGPIPAELAGQLQAERRSERWRAAEALSDVEPGAAGVAALTAALADADDPILRWQAGIALAHSADPAARQALLDALRSDDPNVKMAAADALRLMPPDPEISAALVAALDGSRDALRQSLVEAIARHPSAEATPALLLLLQRGRDPLVRRAAAIALGHSADPSVRKALLRALSRPGEERIVLEAIDQALARLPEIEVA